jgi:DNA-binding MarR family transcriptional regulator
VRTPGDGVRRAQLPLPALLSQILVAFTIEFDNEFEHQMPHRTTRGPAARSRRGPWLVSLVMWSNFMRFVAEEGVPVGELQALAGLSKEAIDSQLTRMEKWWGYVAVEPDPADSRPKPPRRDWIVRPSSAGHRAQQVWRPLAGVIENRWQERFGEDEIGMLQSSLQALVSQLDVGLPRYLPMGGTAGGHLEGQVPAGAEDDIASRLDLSVLLARALLAFTIDFERESALSLAISANALRVLTAEGVRLRDIPRRAAVSKEAISVQLGILEGDGSAVVEPDPAGSRAKLARLTPKGVQAQVAYLRLLGLIEERWQARFGPENIRTLRDGLEGLFGESEEGRPRLAQGLEPYPDGWRAHQPYLAQTTAMTRDPSAALPHYPVVSHCGGFPDGS